MKMMMPTQDIAMMANMQEIDNFTDLANGLLACEGGTFAAKITGDIIITKDNQASDNGSAGLIINKCNATLVGAQPSADHPHRYRIDGNGMFGLIAMTDDQTTSFTNLDFANGTVGWNSGRGNINIRGDMKDADEPEDSTFVTFQDCGFRDNLAVAAGAAVSIKGANVTMDNCTFERNHSGSRNEPDDTPCKEHDEPHNNGYYICGRGGAIWNEGDLRLSNTNFHNNTALWGGNDVFVYSDEHSDSPSDQWPTPQMAFDCSSAPTGFDGQLYSQFQTLSTQFTQECPDHERPDFENGEYTALGWSQVDSNGIFSMRSWCNAPAHPGHCIASE